MEPPTRWEGYETTEITDLGRFLIRNAACADVRVAVHTNVYTIWTDIPADVSTYGHLDVRIDGRADVPIDSLCEKAASAKPAATKHEHK